MEELHQGTTYAKKTDPLQYWRNNQYTLPVMTQLAPDHLAIAASSAASERVVSIGGKIVTKKLNRLHPRALRMLICPKNWGIIHRPPDGE